MNESQHDPDVTCKEKNLFILCFLVLTVLSACAPSPNPQRMQKIAEMRSVESDIAFREKEVGEKISRCYAEAYRLDREATLISNYPGWPELLQIIKGYSSIEYFE